MISGTMEKETLGIIGAGAWGTGMAVLQSGTWNRVNLWAFEAETVENINEHHENSVFLPGITLPSNIHATSDLEALVQEHDVIISAVPSHVTRIFAQKLRPFIRPTHRLVLLTKGIESDSLKLMSEIYQEELEGIPQLAVLSGPNFAKEVASLLPTAAVLGCADKVVGKELQMAMNAPSYRVYGSQDMIGVQVGGAVKNVIALAAGMCDGLELGLSARAALIARGLAEMKKLGVLLGGKMETFLGLSGVGDLILTATGSLSRNYSLGLELGRGTSLEAAMSGKQSVAEAVKNAVPLHQMAQKFHIELPICDAVYAVLYSNLHVNEAIKLLLERDLPETE